MITVEDYLFFVDEALDAMMAIVEELGDDLVNSRPDIDASNTPYIILTHCLGVMEYWGGHVVAGRRVERDRDAEFRSAGPVLSLVERVRSARAQLIEDLAAVEPFAPPRQSASCDYAPRPLDRTQGRALMHLYGELAQHRGQMEGCRDILLAPWANLVPQDTSGDQP